MSQERMIKVDGVATPKELSSLKWKKSDVSGSNAGRTLDVKMHKNRIGQKRTLSLGWVSLTKAEIKATLELFDPEYVDITYWDPRLGLTTKNFYTGDMEANVKWWYSGHERFSTLSFDVIER